ncbi:unnamed protein product [Oncorhynchus mykiss]|uniref:Uncharacterized protein n=1 Tax=Oncorhynchus mykiss TaxID=8022 RepID=A0A060XTQ6_ONCMY|nr:unnamed protein product [Oncorhynchus mykiss]
MASSSSVLSEEQFLCSICLDVFTEPVSIQCGHNFCIACIRKYWDGNEMCQCPMCKKTFYKRPDLFINTFISEMAAHSSDQLPAKTGEVSCDICTGMKLKALKSCLVCQTSYCETHLEPHQRVPALKRHKLIKPVENLEDRMCKKHDRLLELFCRTDQTCVCQFCTEAKHKTHNTVPLEEEYGEKMAELGKMMAAVQQMLHTRSRKVKEIKQSVELSKRAERLIKELEREITELQRRSTKLEQLSHTEDHLHLLQSFPSLCTLPPTKDWSKISVHSDLYVGTGRRVVSQLEETLNKEMDKVKLKRAQRYAVDVTLDPDTANPYIILSTSGKEVRYQQKQQDLLDNPKRFSTCPCVLGNKGVSSGRSYYEVTVKGKTKWDLGVARESINRKGNITLSPKDGYWTVALRERCKYLACTSTPVLLSLREKPQKVGVFVDYEEGQVSFYDVEARSHIYSFTGCTFAKKLYPYLGPCANFGDENSAPLIISPVNHTD